MSARSIINEGFYELLIKYGRNFMEEGCDIEHRAGWLEAIHWLGEQENIYGVPSNKERIKTYHDQLNAQTAKARAYALLTREEVKALYTPAFASHRKLAIEWYAVRRTLTLFIAAPPQELPFDGKPTIEQIREIRLAQLEFQHYTQFNVSETPQILREIARVENQDELLRRKFMRNKRWYL